MTAGRLGRVPDLSRFGIALAISSFERQRRSLARRRRVHCSENQAGTEPALRRRMTPQVWLFRNDSATMRTVQRETDEGIEVLMVGSSGDRAHHTFASSGEAATFREALRARFERSGFTLAWTTGGQ